MVKTKIGDLFQQETKYQRGHLPGGDLDWASKPATYKSYPSAPRIQLSSPETKGGPPIWDSIRQRRSLRAFQEPPLKEAELSQLLWAGQGITDTGMGFAFRTTPSAGALYPLETYAVVHSVEGIEPGVYHYSVQTHELEQLKLGDFRMAAARMALDQGIAHSAKAVFVWTALFARSKWKYRQRGYRYVYLDAGHIAQNVALAAVALGLGSCQIAAIYDDEVNALLGVDGVEESAIYLTVIGKPG